MKIFNQLKKIAIVTLSIITSGCSFIGGKTVHAEDHFEPQMVQLIHAIEKGDQSKAQNYLDQGLDLNIRGEHGLTPLLYFMSNKDIPSMKLAMQLGADPNFKGVVYPPKGHSWEVSPIGILSDGGSTKIFKLLLEYGADPNTLDNNTPILFNVIGQDDWEKFDLILEFGGDVNVKDYGGRRASMYAVNIMKFDFVIKLIEMGDDVYALSDYRDTLGFKVAMNLNRGATVSGFRVPKEVYEIKEMLENKGIIFPELPFEMERKSIDLVRQSMAKQAQSLAN